jgi:hypothetical protein
MCQSLKLNKTAVAKLSLKSIVFYNKNISGFKQFQKKDDEENKPVQKVKEEKPAKRKYVLNKKEVRKRLLVLFETRAFKYTKRFWTISFPLHISEPDRYRILNIFLTRLRRDYELKHYIWVAERHENGTLHFHLITNITHDVQELNGILKASVINIAKSLDSIELVEAAERYNGFDIAKKKGKDKKSIAAYITKYVTKNNSEFTGLAWYCSKSVSNLCTGVEVSQEYIFSEFTEAFLVNGNSFYFEGEHFKYFAFERILWCDATKEILKYNNELIT